MSTSAALLCSSHEISFVIVETWKLVFITMKTKYPVCAPVNFLVEYYARPFWAGLCTNKQAKDAQTPTMGESSRAQT